MVSGPVDDHNHYVAGLTGWSNAPPTVILPFNGTNQANFLLNMLGTHLEVGHPDALLKSHPRKSGVWILWIEVSKLNVIRPIGA